MRACGLMLLVTMGCGAGAVAETARPKEPRAAPARGQVECADLAAGAEPLVVDWKAEQRGALEAAMKDGVAVVAYGCKGLELLRKCKLDGGYGYIGMTPKKQVLQLESSDDRRASVEVATITVGTWRSTWSGPTSADLKGECAGATHYVRGATVGAFAQASRSRSRGSARASDPAECAKSSPQAESPPAPCAAPLRLLLSPISAQATDLAEVDLRTWVAADGAPEEPAAAVGPFEKACADGDGAGCTALGKSMASTDPIRALALFERGCAGGDVAGCAAAGAQHLGSGAPGAKRDALKARTALSRACQGGDGPSCAALGVLYDVGDAQLPKQPNLAEMLLRRGCRRGSVAACGALGMTLAGKPGGGEVEAKRQLERACSVGYSLACAALKVAFGEARSVVPDMQQRMALNTACMGGSARACAHVGLLDAAAGNSIAARPTLQRACSMGDDWACFVRSKLFNSEGRVEAREPQ